MIDDLIKRLEKATGPDWELNKAIALACVPGAREHTPFDDQWIQIPSEIERDEWQVVLPLPYTASIDAALTLVQLSPDGATHWGIELDRGFESWVSRNNVKSGHWLVQGFASTPAIALCIAALRARAAIAAKTETAT